MRTTESHETIPIITWLTKCSESLDSDKYDPTISGIIMPQLALITTLLYHN